MVNSLTRILFDECMSPRLVARARARGYDATHISYLGKGSWQDYNLVEVILQGGYLFVTNNARDFLKLFGQIEVHDGLVLIIPQVRRADQIALFEAALDFIETLGDTVNRLIEVHSVDDIRLSNLPPADDEE